MSVRFVPILGEFRRDLRNWGRNRGESGPHSRAKADQIRPNSGRVRSASLIELPQHEANFGRHREKLVDFGRDVDEHGPKTEHVIRNPTHLVEIGSNVSSTGRVWLNSAQSWPKSGKVGPSLWNHGSTTDRPEIDPRAHADPRSSPHRLRPPPILCLQHVVRYPSGQAAPLLCLHCIVQCASGLMMLQRPGRRPARMWSDQTQVGQHRVRSWSTSADACCGGRPTSAVEVGAISAGLRQTLAQSPPNSGPEFDRHR